jgi:hypothetical protein
LKRHGKAAEEGKIGEYLHHVLQCELNSQRHIRMTQDEWLVHVFVDSTARALLFCGHNVVWNEASAARSRALAVAIACINATHAQAAVASDFYIERVIFGVNHEKLGLRQQRESNSRGELSVRASQSFVLAVYQQFCLRLDLSLMNDWSEEN